MGGGATSGRIANIIDLQLIAEACIELCSLRHQLVHPFVASAEEIMVEAESSGPLGDIARGLGFELLALG